MSKLVMIAVFLLGSLNSVSAKEMKGQPISNDFSVEGKTAVYAAAANEKLLSYTGGKFSLIGPKYWQTL